MSWWKENEFSEAELQPRKRLPVGHGPHSIARVQPLVPEVSLYCPPEPSQLLQPEQPLQLQPESSRPQQRIPLRSPLSPLRNPQNALNKENSNGGKAKKATTNEDVLEALNRQNDQLAKLQDQVQRLLAKQAEKELVVAASQSTGNLGTPKTNSGAAPKQSESTPTLGRLLSDSSTQTSVPPSPEKKPVAVNTSFQVMTPPDLELHEIGVNTSTIKWPTTTEEETNTSIRSNLRDGYNNTEFLNDDASSRSLVLGESVSMYEDIRRQKKDDEDEDVVVAVSQYDQILNQVERLLKPVNSPSPRPSPQTDSVTATIERVRQIGVSFIRPEDLVPKQEVPLKKYEVPFDTMYQPKVVDLERMGGTPSPSPSTTASDTSLIINSAALKYLDDFQLSKVATKHQKRAKRFFSEEKEPKASSNKGLMNYGLPDTHLSMATKEFLKHHQLVLENEDDDDDEEENRRKKKKDKKPKKILENISAILRQPKFL